MNTQALVQQTQPTLYFIGVTTTQSSIMQVFPEWSRILGLNAQVVGFDAPLHAPPDVYREIVQHIKTDALSMGALITTHKIDLLRACRDLFDELDPYAQICDEISCISKRGGTLRGHAKDPITSGLALEHFIPRGYWQQSGADVLCLGAGGAAIAITVFLAEQSRSGEYPRRVIVVDVAQKRLDALRDIHRHLKTPIEFEYHLTISAAENDAIMARLREGSLVINATGLGKDRPGSPLTDAGRFPLNGFVWELNYRGERDFIKQASQQADDRHLTVQDGWVYFLHGWSQVIAEVFALNLTPELFTQLDHAASALRPT